MISSIHMHVTIQTFFGHDADVSIHDSGLLVHDSDPEPSSPTTYMILGSQL